MTESEESSRIHRSKGREYSKMAILVRLESQITLKVYALNNFYVCTCLRVCLYIYTYVCRYCYTYKQLTPEYLKVNAKIFKILGLSYLKKDKIPIKRYINID